MKECNAGGKKEHGRPDDINFLIPKRGKLYETRPELRDRALYGLNELVREGEFDYVGLSEVASATVRRRAHRRPFMSDIFRNTHGHMRQCPRPDRA